MIGEKVIVTNHHWCYNSKTIFTITDETKQYWKVKQSNSNLLLKKDSDVVRGMERTYWKKATEEDLKDIKINNDAEILIKEIENFALNFRSKSKDVSEILYDEKIAKQKMIKIGRLSNGENIEITIDITVKKRGE